MLPRALNRSAAAFWGSACQVGAHTVLWFGRSHHSIVAQQPTCNMDVDPWTARTHTNLTHLNAALAALTAAAAAAACGNAFIDSSVYCSQPSCIAAASLASAMCVHPHAAEGIDGLARLASAPQVDVASPVYAYYSLRRSPPVKRFDWVVTWKNLTLDGFERPVSRLRCVRRAQRWRLRGPAARTAA